MAASSLPDWWQRLRGGRFARLFALADQGFQGVASIAAMALLGRTLPHDAFGAVGVMIGIYFFVAGFHRSAVVLPYITEHETFADDGAAARYHSDWWWLSVAASLLLAALLLGLAGATAAVAPSSGAWLVAPLLMGALITPAMLASEFARRWLYKLDRPDLAALLSLCFFVVLVGGAGVAAALRPDVWGGALAWLAAGAASTLVAFAHVRVASPITGASLDCFRRHRGFATWLALNILPYTIYSTASVVILIGALIGPGAAAVFTAARTLTNPAVSIVSAIDSTDKPRAARALAEQGVAGLRRSIAGTRHLLIAATGGYLGLVALAAAPLLQLVFHDQYPHIAGEVRLLCLAFFLFCLNQPSETMLIVLRASRTMFVTRLVTAIATVIALALAIPHGVSGMAIAIAASQLVNLAILFFAERHVARSAEEPAR